MPTEHGHGDRIRVVQMLTDPSAWYNHWLIYAVTISVLPCVNLLQWHIYLQHPGRDAWLWFALLPFTGFVVVPIADMVMLPLVEKLYNMRDKMHVQIRGSKKPGSPRSHTMYSAVMYWYVLFHTIVYFTTMRWIGMHLSPLSLSPDFLLATFSLAMLSVAPGVAVGHELFHKLTWYEGALGNWLMNLFMYGHFKYLHCQHHHKWVATRHDTATARYGESIYHFVPRSAFTGYIVAWKDIELKRLKERRIPFFSLRNRMLVAFLVSFVALPLGISIAFGKSALVAFVLQGAMAIVMVEIVNYFEHYGLRRKKRTLTATASSPSTVHEEAGEPQLSSYGRVTHMHSWDAFYPISNYLSLNLNFHAFHHEHPVALYNAMQPTLASPRMPLPYPFMFLIALVSPLFYRVVHPLLEHLQQHRDKQTQTQNCTER